MLKGLNHIGIIVSSEKSLDFYKLLGFKELTREVKQDKGYTLIFMRDTNGVTLEMFIKDGSEHQLDPEQRGLRHISFDVESTDKIKEILKEYTLQKEYVMENGKKIIFFLDVDNQPVEFAEIGSINLPL